MIFCKLISHSSLHDEFLHMIGISELKICTKNLKFNSSFYSCNNEIFNGNNLSMEIYFCTLFEVFIKFFFFTKIESHHENSFFCFLKFSFFFQKSGLAETKGIHTLYKKCLCLFHECLGFVTGSVKCLNPYYYFDVFYNVYSWP